MRPRMINEAKRKGGWNKKLLPDVVQGFMQGSGVTEATKISFSLASNGTNAARVLNFVGCGFHQIVVDG